MFPVYLALVPVDIQCMVTRKKDTFVECTESSVCLSNRCFFLCHHTYKCIRYDFNNGNVCKHVFLMQPLYMTKHNAQLENTANEENSRVYG